MKENAKRENWIDILKFVAIMGVLIDHSYETLYTDLRINMLSYYAVPLFILIGGFNAYYSEKRNSSIPYLRNIYRKLCGIIPPYVLGTIFASIYYNHKFNLAVVMRCLITFSAIPPFYYIYIFIQLLLISRILYKLVVFISRRNYSILLFLCSLTLFLGISYIFSIYTDVSYIDLWGPGNYLFGGFCLFIFYFGMILGCIYENKETTIIKAYIMVCMCIVGIIVWINKINDIVEFGTKYCCNLGLDYFSASPIIHVFFSLMIFEIICSINYIIKHYDVSFFNILKVFELIGRHTLYIFLFHLIFKFIFKGYIGIYIQNIWLYRVVCMGFMVFIPIAIECVFNRVYVYCLKTE